MPENNELAVVLRLVADQFKAELRASHGAVGAFNEFLKDWKTQLAAAGTALFALAKSTANFGEEVLKGAQKTGLAVQSFSTLSHAAKMADIDNQQLVAGLKALSVNMVEAQQKTGDGEAIFRRLGISAVDAAGKLRPTEDVLLDIADVFAKYADGAGKTEAATKLLGKAGIELIPFLNQGKAGINEIREAGRLLGLELSENDAKAADQFNQKLKEVDATVQALTVTIGLPLMRGLMDVWQLFTELEAAVKRTWEQMEGFSTHLSQNFGKTGVGQGLMDLFTQLGFGHRQGEGQGPNEKALLDALGVNQRINVQHAQKGRDVHAEIKKPMPSIDGGGSKDKSFDQEKWAKEKVTLWTGQWNEQHAKALLEIWLMGNRALEIQNKLIGEELDLMFRQEQIADEGRQKQDARDQEQLAAGLDNAERMLAANEQAQRRELEGRAKLAQAWIDYDHQVGASTEQRYTHQMDLLRATLTNETQLRQDEAARLLMAWQNNDEAMAAQILSRTQMTAQERETIELQYLTKIAAINQQYSDNIFDGWALGLQRYVQDTQSAFGLGADIARRTAQFMEQSFQGFFFDLFEGKIRSLKDVFKSFGDFAKKVIAQVIAQLLVMLALKAASNAMSGGFGGMLSGFGGMFGGGGGGGSLVGGAFNMDGTPIEMARGGAVLGTGNQDTVRAMLMPGEGVLSRRGMAMLDRLNGGMVPAVSQPRDVPNINISIVNSGRTDRPEVRFRQEVKSIFVDLIYRDSDVRQMLQSATA